MGARFEWDEPKRLANLNKHGIDFRDAVAVFDGPHLTTTSHRAGEARRVSLGVVGDAVVAVIWTDRDGVIRLISVRVARRDERKVYYARFGT